MARFPSICVVVVLPLLASVDGQAGDCACDEAKLRGGWCKECRVGYVAAIRIESEDLFEALDAHGHDIDPKRFECSSCQKALKSDGYCHSCRMGFVNKQAYLSPLAYHLARGKVIGRRDIACEPCKKQAGKTGWCKACRRGWIGFVSIQGKDEYDRAAQAYALVAAAVKTLSRCETCAIAMVTRGRCPSCDVSYKDGKPVKHDKPVTGKGSIREP